MASKIFQTSCLLYKIVYNIDIPIYFRMQNKRPNCHRRPWRHIRRPLPQVPMQLRSHDVLQESLPGPPVSRRTPVPATWRMLPQVHGDSHPHDGEGHVHPPDLSATWGAHIQHRQMHQLHLSEWDVYLSKEFLSHLELLAWSTEEDERELLQTVCYAWRSEDAV